MAGIITDPTQFYKFAALDIWAGINPQLGEYVRQAQIVAQSLIIYNKSYPPPPPNWKSTLGTLVLTACCCAVVGAAILSESGVIGGATSAPTVSSNAATVINSGANAAAASSGTVIPSSLTISPASASAFAVKAASVVGPIAKTYAQVTGNTDAEKIAKVSDLVNHDTPFTQAVVSVYSDQAKQHNLVVAKEGQDDFHTLAYNQQQNYAAYLKRQADAMRQQAGNLPPWVIPIGGAVAAILLRG